MQYKNYTKRGFTPTPKRFGGGSQSERGFVLLLGSLIGSLLLVVGLAIFNITLKEVILSSAARESQFAFYAADTGIECALNWDFNYDNGIISTSTVFATSTASPVPPLPANCVGYDLRSIWVTSKDANAATTTFDLDVGEGCVTVQVTKFGTPSRTRIESRGHNTCNIDDPRRVERAIFVAY